MRKLYGWAVIAWIGPGAAVSWLWKDAVPWVTFMSWYAIVIAHATMWQARRAEDAGHENNGGGSNNGGI